MSDLAIELAVEARRAGLVTALRKVLANLRERGLLKRRGVTSGTRYCLVLDSCVDPKREGCP